MNFRAATSLIAALSVVFVARSAMAATCTLGEHEGIEDAEAKVASGVVCHELAARSKGTFEVQLGKLSGRTLVTVVNTQDGAHVRTFVSSMDEIDVAAPRLASALVEAKPLVETRNVDNVLAEEGRAAKKVASVVGANMGTYVQSSFGAPAAPSAGISVGLAFRTGQFGLTADGRVGGIGSGETKLGNASLDVGARLFLTNGELAPFLGGGVALSYFNRNGANDNDRSGSGGSAFATVGVEALRSSQAGVLVALRADMPFYELEGQSRTTMSYSEVGYTRTTTPAGASMYVVPVSINIALAFH